MRGRILCLTAVMLTAVTACSTTGNQSGVPPTTASSSASGAASATSTSGSSSASTTTSTVPPTSGPTRTTTSATSARPTSTSTTTRTSTSTTTRPPTSTTTRTSTTKPPTSTTTRTTTTSTTSALPAGWAGTDWTRLPTTQKVFALTFDAGASNTGVSSILSTLQSRNVRATFFVTGEFARNYPSSVRSIARAGYPVGNHSDTHPHFPLLTNDQIALQLSRAETSITALTGTHAKPLFRFPFGDRQQADITVVNRLGYIPFNWTVDSLGWEGTTEPGAPGSAAAVCKRVVDAAVPGGIALMHVGANPDDGTIFDANALPCIINGISAKGYRFVDLRSQLP